MTTIDQSILDALMSHGHLDRPELTRAVPSLPRGMPGHYILKELEDSGLIKSQLSTRDQPSRLYQIEEKGKGALEEMKSWAHFDHHRSASE